MSVHWRYLKKHLWSVFSEPKYNVFWIFVRLSVPISPENYWMDSTEVSAVQMFIAELKNWADTRGFAQLIFINEYSHRFCTLDPTDLKFHMNILHASQIFAYEEIHTSLFQRKFRGPSHFHSLNITDLKFLIKIVHTS